MGDVRVGEWDRRRRLTVEDQSVEVGAYDGFT